MLLPDEHHHKCVRYWEWVAAAVDNRRMSCLCWLWWTRKPRVLPQWTSAYDAWRHQIHQRCGVDIQRHQPFIILVARVHQRDADSRVHPSKLEGFVCSCTRLRYVAGEWARVFFMCTRRRGASARARARASFRFVIRKRRVNNVGAREQSVYSSSSIYNIRVYAVGRPYWESAMVVQIVAVCVVMMGWTLVVALAGRICAGLRLCGG